MMLQSRLLFSLSIGVGCISGAFGVLFYPNPQASLLEHLLVDTHGAHASGFANAITPCKNYVNGAQTLGRQTSAQWIRVAFHDFVTAHVINGTGGMDASIGFETLREEDSGSAMNDSLSFFRPFVNPKVSTADFIALSVVISVGNCGGLEIPLRGGRIDATEAGPFGVPAPDTDLPTTLSFFANAGFNQVDSIGLTACGHTLGRVHHAGFPTVVGPDAVTPNNTGGGIPFDSTVDVFDPLVVHEYLNGTGNQGGALVTSFNISSRSDLRLYESDNNATMIALANQGEAFLDTCVKLLERMINTVPKTVILSDVITPIDVKPVNATLDFDTAGNLIFSGYIRILTSASSATPQSIQLATSLFSKPLSLTPEAATGTSVFGTTTFFPFSTNISYPNVFPAFSVLGYGPPRIFPVETKAFVVPSQTSVSANNVTTTVNFTVAVSSNFNSYSKRIARGSNTPIVKIEVPVGQQGTLGPAIATFDNLDISHVGVYATYDLWQGSLDVGDLATGPLTVALLDEKGDEIDIGLFS